MLDIREVQAAGDAHASPIIGPTDHRLHVDVDVTALDNTVVDAKGYLKPGVLFNDDDPSTLIGAADVVAYVNLEAIKVANGNTAPDLAAASASHTIAMATRGDVNRDILEDVLGRALTADELAGFAGSLFRLTHT